MTILWRWFLHPQKAFLAPQGALEGFCGVYKSWLEHFLGLKYCTPKNISKSSKAGTEGPVNFILSKYFWEPNTRVQWQFYEDDSCTPKRLLDHQNILRPENGSERTSLCVLTYSSLNIVSLILSQNKSLSFSLKICLSHSLSKYVSLILSQNMSLSFSLKICLSHSISRFISRDKIWETNCERGIFWDIYLYQEI